MKPTFVESLVFSARWHKRRDDAMLKALQEEPPESPSAGDPIPGAEFSANSGSATSAAARASAAASA